MRHTLRRPAESDMGRRFLGAGLICLALVLAVPASGQDLESAVEAEATGDYVAARREYRRLAEQGNADAQFILAGMYYDGIGGPQDYKESIKWYRLAAEQGNPDFQSILARMYFDGRGVQKDYFEAAKWYQRAAEQGNSKDQAKLGWMYANNRGVPLNYKEAIKWYKLAAEQHNDWAQYNLGILYSRGQGVPQDFVQAHMWFNLSAASAAQGRPQAAEARDRLAGNMTSAQIAEAQELAKEWLERYPK